MVQSGINFGRSTGGIKLDSRLGREKGLVYNIPSERYEEGHKHT
jgi:hypothetical protein